MNLFPFSWRILPVRCIEQTLMMG